MNKRRLRCELVLVPAAILISSTACGASASSKEEAAREAANARFACAQRAAILFCRLRGVAPPKGLEADLPVVSEGTSMLELQEALESHGVACELRRVNPSELSAAPLPAIVRFLPGHLSDGLGHFVLVTSMEDIGPTVVDPITGLADVRGWRYFSDEWSGHCILPARSPVPFPLGVIFIGMLALSLLLRVASGARSGRRRIGSVALLALLMAPGGPLRASEAIRSHERDGANAVILFAATVDPDLKSLVRHLNSSQSVRALSMLDVQHALEGLSLRTRLRLIRFSDLVALREPAIVLLRRDGQGRSQYGIVLNASDDRVTVLHTGAVVVQELSEDDFRTAWSGHVLLADRRPDRPFLAASAALGGMMGLVIITIKRRCLRKYVRADYFT